MAADAAVQLPPAAPPARPRVLLVGTALATGATVMVMAALIGMYLSQRAGVIASGETWLPKGTTIPLTPGTMAFGTMLLSLVTVQWAIHAVANNDRPSAYLALGITVLFGAAVINATSFLYTQVGLPVASTTGVLFYAVTGAHLAMIIAGLVFIGVMTFRTLGGEYEGRDHEGLTAASLFWYATTAVHGVIWYAVYITK